MSPRSNRSLPIAAVLPHDEGRDGQVAIITGAGDGIAVRSPGSPARRPRRPRSMIRASDRGRADHPGRGMARTCCCHRSVVTNIIGYWRHRHLPGRGAAAQEAARRLGKGGRIVNVSSTTALFAMSGISLYAGSKAALEQFTEVWAKELAPRGITVDTVGTRAHQPRQHRPRPAGAARPRGGSVTIRAHRHGGRGSRRGRVPVQRRSELDQRAAPRCERRGLDLITRPGRRTLISAECHGTGQPPGKALSQTTNRRTLNRRNR